MQIKSDIDIAQSVNARPIAEIASKLGLEGDDIEEYGKYKAKIIKHVEPRKGSKLILVTAMSPTKAGEGKTTTTIGLADGINKLGKNAIVAMREPSLGPVFGMKGGATGGGLSQVLPMEDINLHFTGDFHAIGSANNLLCAMLDNHIYQGNSLRIDPSRVLIHRCVDMNDRQLRRIVSGLGGKTSGVPRSDYFDITVATEMMAVFCLAKDLADLKARIARETLAYDYDGKPVTARDLLADGAAATLLKDAIYPNLAQTIGGTPAIIHGGPFANIAHGCNSVIATNTALGLADYVITEAGFGSDLGAEKFLDIKCRELGRFPDALVVVASVRAVQINGTENLIRHAANMRDVYGIPCVVAINKFQDDTDEQIRELSEKIAKAGFMAIVADPWGQGGDGCIEIAEAVIEASNTPSNPRYCYELEDSIQSKINKVCTRIYHAGNIEYSDEAKNQILALEASEASRMPVCISKTQYSFSDNAKLLGAPENFTIHVRDVHINSGAGFLVVLTGNILTMPGLPKEPAAKGIDIDNSGKISGLY